MIGNENPGAAGRKPRRRQAGQNLVELALLTPLLLAMVLGAIELGRYAYFSIMVGDAAHAGALYGAQNIGDAADAIGICTAAENDYNSQSGMLATSCTTSAGSSASTWSSCPSGSTCSGLAVYSTDGCGCDVGGTYTQDFSTTADCDTATMTPSSECTSTSEWVVTVSVTATATFQSLFNYPWIPSSITVARTATVRVGSD